MNGNEKNASLKRKYKELIALEIVAGLISLWDLNCIDDDCRDAFSKEVQVFLEEMFCYDMRKLILKSLPGEIVEVIYPPKEKLFVVR